MPTLAPLASTSSSHRIMRVAFAWIVGVFFFLPISILPAQELADILEVADRLDDESFCQVVSGVRQGIQGRKISSPESFSAWMAKVKKRSDPAALQQAILLGVALGDEPSIADARDHYGYDRGARKQPSQVELKRIALLPSGGRVHDFCVSRSHRQPRNKKPRKDPKTKQ